MQRHAVLTAIVLAAALTAGCVDRKFTVTSDPPNAAVYRNGTYIGQTPVDDAFVYYGIYEFKVVKDGYETTVTRVPIKTPWYEYLGLDLLTENFWPFWVRDHRPLFFPLPPKVREREEDVLKRATELRERGKSIGAPAVDGPMPPGMGIAPPTLPIGTSPLAPTPPVFPGATPPATAPAPPAFPGATSGTTPGAAPAPPVFPGAATGGAPVMLPAPRS